MNRGPKDSAQKRRKYADGLLLPRKLFTPHLDGIHYIRSNTLEECFWLMGCTMNARAVTEYMVCYKYLDWYFQDADADRKYRDYADLLRILQAARPGQRLVLKSLEHMENPHILLKHLPGAMLVQTHRLPSECIPSYISLNSVVVALAMKGFDQKRHARKWVELGERSMTRHLQNRKKLDKRIWDHRYADMLKDPVGSVRRVCEFFGIAWNERVAAAVARHTRENQQHKYGTHKYRIGDFGLTAEGVNGRFADYIRTYLA
jgi:hypothetical protein